MCWVKAYKIPSDPGCAKCVGVENPNISFTITEAMFCHPRPFVINNIDIFCENEQLQA